MKGKLSLAAILSIATAVVLSGVTPAESCMRSKYNYNRETYEQPSWLRSPLAVVITLPGIALATALSLGGKSYEV